MKPPASENLRFDNVWDALCDTPEQAQNMRLRAELMHGIHQTLTRRGLSQAEAARLCGITAPRMNNLMVGRISRFSLDALVNIAAALGLHLHLQLPEDEAAPV